MPKLLILRQSGRPTKPEAIKAYNEEWPLLFDKIQERVKEIVQREKPKYLAMTPSHILSQRMCNFIERQLFKKHAVDEYIELPRSSKAWAALSEHYDGPILVARKQDDSGLVLIIMDQLGG